MNVDKSIRLNKRGFIFHSTRKFAEAISAFTAAIQLNPNYAIAYFNRGETWFALREFEKGIVDYTR